MAELIQKNDLSQTPLGSDTHSHSKADQRLRDAESRRQAILAQIAGTSWQISLVATGGGSGMLRHCFARSGASKNFVEGIIPYARNSLVEYLGDSPDFAFASAEAAGQLAAIAFDRAQRLTDIEGEPAGISLAAALPTIPERQGSESIHTSLHTKNKTVIWSVELPKSRYSRAFAEAICEEMMLLALSNLVANDDAEIDVERFLKESGLKVTNSVS